MSMMRMMMMISTTTKKTKKKARVGGKVKPAKRITMRLTPTMTRTKAVRINHTSSKTRTECSLSSAASSRERILENQMQTRARIGFARKKDQLKLHQLQECWSNKVQTHQASCLNRTVSLLKKL